LLGAGTDSAAFRVDGEWVVRFPLAPEAQRALRTELSLLPELAPTLPVAVPCPEHIGEREGLLLFSAYRALDGEPLSHHALNALSDAGRARALSELAAVLDALARQRREFERAQPAPCAPMLLHSDIKPAHLLHHPASGRLAALLDWGDASLGHGDFDLAIISAFCGTHTLDGLLERLDDVERRRARAGVPFLLSIRWLQDALSDGPRHLLGPTAPSPAIVPFANVRGASPAAAFADGCHVGLFVSAAVMAAGAIVALVMLRTCEQRRTGAPEPSRHLTSTPRRLTPA
jgi:aminoglycoside phosphotransferase (APT) family kinase protein